MTPASLPPDEAHRLAALRALKILDSRREAEFDALVRVAAAACETPIALITLIDAHRQWFKAHIGFPSASETTREVAFCAHTILADGLFEVPDATTDVRFADNPLVVDEPHVRFYAGVPLTLSSGFRVGTLCVIDRVPRQLTDVQRAVLTDLAEAVAHALEGRSAIERTHEMAEELVEKHEQLRVTLRSIDDAVITTDAAGRVSWLNPVAETLTGWSTVDARGHDLAQVFRIVIPSTRTPIEGVVERGKARAGRKGDLVEALLIGRHGSEFRIEKSISGTLSEEGVPQSVVIVFRDVTERRRLLQEMTFRSTHDPLTGLFNRAEFELRLERMRKTAVPGRTDHALLYIDLDRFKLINEACGHDAGDRLLQNVAGILKESVRSRDVVSRIGGDEFAILLESCPIADANRLARSICDRMAEYRFVEGDRSFRVGTSIGLAAIDGHWASIALLLQAAGAACYAAKEGGRNRVHVWFEDNATTHQRTGDVHWVSSIQEAIDEDRLVLYAQRIESLRHDEGGIHAEVLLRMVERDGSLIQPATFLPAVERFQLAPLVDRWVLRRALEWMRTEAGPERITRLSVNLSGQSVGDAEFCAWALAMLADAGEETCRRLCLEITETAAVTHMDDAVVFIRQARQLGVRIALDDFGAGSSSFGYLKTLVVDCIKIDGQFIRGLLDDPLDSAAVRCFVDVARLMGLETVAEFVDQPPILARLREMGVDFAQGYLLHRPAPIGELLQDVRVAAIPTKRARPVARPSVLPGYRADVHRTPSPVGLLT
jgi:diguanylate cyclase (GGDEF)-like protein/PAS domain S-box-containing protein